MTNQQELAYLRKIKRAMEEVLPTYQPGEEKWDVLVAGMLRVGARIVELEGLMTRGED